VTEVKVVGETEAAEPKGTKRKRRAGDIFLHAELAGIALRGGTNRGHTAALMRECAAHEILTRTRRRCCEKTVVE
jgi:hypothetical protein